MNHHQKVSRLRELHGGSGFLLANAWNAGSALQMQKLGALAVGTTSAGVAMDLGLLDGQAGKLRTLTVCEEIVRTVDVPVSADLENGFDDSPEGCVELVAAAAARGVAGGSIEDATGRPDDPIYPFDQAVARIRAIAEALRGGSFDFVLTARAENFVHGRSDLADTIARLRAFEDAGAEVLFAPGLPDLQSILAVRSAIKRPLNVLWGSDSENLSVRQLFDAGVDRVSLGPLLARAAQAATENSARTFLQQSATTEQATSKPDLRSKVTPPSSPSHELDRLGT